MTDTQRRSRSEYFKQYRQAHKESLNAYRADWRKRNPDKIAMYQRNYWERKLQKSAPRGNDNATEDSIE